MMAVQVLKSKYALWAGKTAFGLMCTLVFLYAGFPTDALVNRLVTEVGRSSKGGLVLKVGQSHLWRGTGVALEHVQIMRPNTAPIVLEAVRVRLRLLPLLLFRTSFLVQLPVGGGALWTTMTRHGDGADIHLEGADLDFTALPAMSHALGIPIAGVASLEGELTAVKDIAHAQGHLNFTLDHLALGPGSVYGLELPQLEMGKLEVELAVGEGRAKIKRFAQTGGKVYISAKGSTELLANNVARSPIDACLRVRLDPTLMEKNPKLRSVMQLAEVQLKRDGDGFLNAPLTGVMGAPQLRPGLCPAR
jgi:type II secretion system protein N